MRAGIGMILAAALLLASAGCGGGSQEPDGPLADALGEISGSGSSSGALGVGWTEPRPARAAGIAPSLMGTALGPNARNAIEAAPELRRRFDFDPLAAHRLISVGGSYAFGVRIDGTSAAGLRDALVAVGGAPPGDGQSGFLDVGDYAVVPRPLLDAGMTGLGARDSFSWDSMTAVLAISDTARDSLVGEGERLIDQPTYRAAADCLGEVVAARMVPDKLLISVELGVDLVAIGIGRRREVLCLLGGTSERADEVAANLRRGLAPDARGPRTGQPVAERVRGVEVSRSAYDDVEVVRATMSPAAGQPEDFLFEAIGSGDLPELINGS